MRVEFLRQMKIDPWKRIGNHHFRFENVGFREGKWL